MTSPRTPMQAGSVSRLENPLSLKVMRLKNPEPYFEWNPGFDSTDYFNGVDCVPISTGALLLPKDFGQIYVGELFRSYVSVNNQTLVPLRRVITKVELRTQQQCTVLLDTSSGARAVFPPKTNQDYIVEHPLTEAGVHTLVCSVSYFDDQAQEDKALRKVFKFPVSQPLSIKAVKIFTVKTHVFVVLELQNLMPQPLVLESVTLDPSPAYALTDHSSPGEDPALEAPMAAEEVRRFLFELAPYLPTGRSSVLGRVEIYWKSPHGGAGHLQTTPIEQHRTGDRPDVELLVDQVPDVVRREVPFEVCLTAHNHTDQALALEVFLPLDRLYPLCFTGPARRPVGPCPPRGRCPFRLTLFAVQPGIHSLHGLELHDKLSDATYPSPSLCIVWVDP